MTGLLITNPRNKKIRVKNKWLQVTQMMNKDKEQRNKARMRKKQIRKQKIKQIRKYKRKQTMQFKRNQRRDKN